MKTLITLLILLLSLLVRAECIDPSDPNCICTNCPPPTNYPGPVHVYTNGEPFLMVLATPTNIFVLLTNADLLNDYIIQRSSDLVTWTNITPKFEADSNGMADAAFPINESQAFFRVIDATYWEYANIGASSGSFNCGSYVGYGNYYGFEGSWGYILNSNVTRHVIYDGQGKTNRIVSWLAFVGEHGCGTYQCEVTDAYIAKYRFSLFAVSGESVPQTNQILRMKGIKEDTDMSRGMIEGPGPNEWGFFY